MGIRRLKDTYKRKGGDVTRESSQAELIGRATREALRQRGSGPAVVFKLPMGDGVSDDSERPSILEVVTQAASAKANQVLEQTIAELIRPKKKMQVPQIKIGQKPGGTKPVALDLGSLIQTGLEGFIDYKKAKLTRGQKNALRDASQYLGTTTQVLDPGGIGLLDFLASDEETADVAEALLGKEKKKRRRRRRLATVSDIRDLAALQQVLGKGEAFKTWIATHPQY